MKNKNSLLVLQQTFYNAIFEPNGPEDAALYKNVNPEAWGTGDQLVNIYRQSIRGGLVEALSNIYPVCVKLVGELFFEHMVEDYLKKFPSRSPDLADYGAEFPLYIKEFEPAKELEYLSDVAVLEWCWHRAFNAANEVDGSVNQLAELAEVPVADQGSIRFHLAPSAFVVRSEFPIQQIWQVNQDEYEGEGIVNLDDGASCLVVWRNAVFGMRIDVLSEQEYAFLKAVKEAKPFGEIATMVSASELTGILGRCMQTGLVVGFELDN